MTLPPKHRLAPWVFVLVFGALVTGILTGLAAYRLESMVWLSLHPEALGGMLTALAAGVGKGVRMMPHFRNGLPPRELDAARERLYDAVIHACDTLTAMQGELDSEYQRVVKLHGQQPDGG
jgi:hypothetical protein